MIKNLSGQSTKALAILVFTPAFSLCSGLAQDSTSSEPASPPESSPVLMEESPAVEEAAPSLYDKVWGSMQLYHNEDNPVIQSLKFTGRFQLDFATISSDQGYHDEWNIRRFRVGGKANLFQHVTLAGEVDIDPQGDDPFYNRLTDGYVAWSMDPSLRFTVGKQGANFTMDGMTSSKELLTIDRSNLANNLWFPTEYMPGVTTSGKVGNWNYLAGGYSGGSDTGDFGKFDGSVFFLGTLGYDFGEKLGVEEAVLTGNYVYNDPDSNNTSTRNLEHVASINFGYDTGKWGFRTDLTGGIGYFGQSDLWGASVMPFYSITDELQIVGRFTYISSEDDNGVRFARYENQLISGLGDEYNEIYVGLNYYFYGHKLKIQTGVQYAEMNDDANDGGEYSGWGWTTGLRISW